MQRGRALALPRVTAHQRAPCVFIERIDPQELPGALDGIAERAIVFEHGDQSTEHLARPLPEAFAVGLDPFVRAVGQKVALIQSGGFLERRRISVNCSIGGRLKRHHVHNR